MSAEYIALLAKVELTTSSTLRVTENAVASTLTVIDPATGSALASTKSFYLRGDGADDDLLQVLVETIQSHAGANTYTAALALSVNIASPSASCTITRATGSNNFQINWSHAGTTVDPAWWGFSTSDTANDGSAKAGTLSPSSLWVSPEVPQVREEHPEYDASVVRSRSGRVRTLRRGGPYHVIDLGFVLCDSRRVLRTDNTSDPDATFMAFLETVGDGTSFELHPLAVSSGTTLAEMTEFTRLRDYWRFDEETSSACRPVREEPGLSLYSFSARAEGFGETNVAVIIPEMPTGAIFWHKADEGLLTDISGKDYLLDQTGNDNNLRENTITSFSAATALNGLDGVRIGPDNAQIFPLNGSATDKRTLISVNGEFTFYFLANIPTPPGAARDDILRITGGRTFIVSSTTATPTNHLWVGDTGGVVGQGDYYEGVPAMWMIVGTTTTLSVYLNDDVAAAASYTYGGGELSTWLAAFGEWLFANMSGNGGTMDFYEGIGFDVAHDPAGAERAGVYANFQTRWGPW